MEGLAPRAGSEPATPHPFCMLSSHQLNGEAIASEDISHDQANVEHACDCAFGAACDGRSGIGESEVHAGLGLRSASLL
jgi:hypothetical protein